MARVFAFPYICRDVWQTMLGAWDKNVGAGGHMSSKLAQRVAVNGLCNSYMAFNTNYHDTGLFGVYAVADKHQPVSQFLPFHA